MQQPEASTVAPYRCICRRPAQQLHTLLVGDACSGSAGNSNTQTGRSSDVSRQACSRLPAPPAYLLTLRELRAYVVAKLIIQVSRVRHGCATCRPSAASAGAAGARAAAAAAAGGDDRLLAGAQQLLAIRAAVRLGRGVPAAPGGLWARCLQAAAGNAALAAAGGPPMRASVRLQPPGSCRTSASARERGELRSGWLRSGAPLEITLDGRDRGAWHRKTRRCSLRTRHETWAPTWFAASACRPTFAAEATPAISLVPGPRSWRARGARSLWARRREAAATSRQVSMRCRFATTSHPGSAGSPSAPGRGGGAPLRADALLVGAGGPDLGYA